MFWKHLSTFSGSLVYYLFIYARLKYKVKLKFVSLEPTTDRIVLF